MRPRGLRRSVSSVTAALSLLLGGTAVFEIVHAPAAAAAVAVTLDRPGTIRSNGPDLTWSRFVPDAGVTFTGYEVHKSTALGFTPSATTRIATISDLAITRYADTSTPWAPYAGAYAFKVVANGTVSNEIRVNVPSYPLTLRSLEADASMIMGDSTSPAPCYDGYNWGAAGVMRVGSGNGETGRALVRFDLRSLNLPSDAFVTTASLRLPYAATTGSSEYVDVHPLRQPWEEGRAMGACSDPGVSWRDTHDGIPWKNAGGSFDPAVASVAPVARTTAGTDEFDVRGLVVQWLAGSPNHGLLLKQRVESQSAANNWFSYQSDDVGDVMLRPQLLISYMQQAPTPAPAPAPAPGSVLTVAVESPAAGQPVRGAAVPLSVVVGDDSPVTKTEYLVDGAVVATATAAPWFATWNSTTASNAAHTLTARVYNSAGGTATSAGRSFVVDNSAAPSAASVSNPTSGMTVAGTVTINASAADDLAVKHVEFSVDGERIGIDTTAPYSFAWNTLDPLRTAFDGAHTLTATAYDAGNQTKTSVAIPVTVANSAGTAYKATFDLNVVGTADDALAVPPATLKNELAAPSDPSATTATLATAPTNSTAAYTGTPASAFRADVTVTNTSAATWTGANIKLWYRWYTPDGVILFEGPATTAFPASVPPGQANKLAVTVQPPSAPVGTDLTQAKLRFDIYDAAATTTNKWFGGRGNKPIDNPVIVEKQLEGALGLERWWQYDGENVGAGMSTLANVANGNMLLRWSPFFAPGRGLASMVDLTYNSLEDHSESPAGNNFSLSISGLTRWGHGLDIHPNKADENTGKSRKYVVLTDGDGTTHEFVGSTNVSGVTTWQEPAGVNLYLRSVTTTDTSRRWALTRPDNVTYWYDDQGFPTAIVDRNGNTMTFVLEDTPPGEDPGGPKRRVTKVLDAAQRAFTVAYWTKAESKGGHVRGKIKTITDHSGSTLSFAYYDDGNLLRLTQAGGTQPDGTTLASRSFVFTYTVPNGTGPAIVDPLARAIPEPKTPSQSTRLFSVRDPRGKETTFAYFGPSEGSQLRWKLKSRTNRSGKTTTFGYNTTGRVTTVDAPLAHDTDYAYDTLGRVTSIVNPEEQTTTLAWSADNKVTLLTEPTTKTINYTYNANGYLTSNTDQLGNRTELTYTNRPVDANDAAGHISLLASRATPIGVASAMAADYQWTFTYDAAGNLDKETDPSDFVTDYDWNLAGSASPGTVSRSVDPNGGITTFEYDASGQPSKVTDPVSSVSQFGYDVDGLLVWMQDPNHVGDSGTDVRAYRSYFDYDPFHRLQRQSAPRSTATQRGVQIWSSSVYDENDNIIKQVDPPLDTTNVVRTASYDAMDRLLTQANPDLTLTPTGETTAYAYDDAGRLVKTTKPKGVLSTAVVDDYTTDYAYDGLDRVVQQVDHGVSATDVRRVFMCYDLAGDLRTVTSPRANVTTVACPATAAAFTTKYDYDAAHRKTAQRDPLGHETRTAYDANGNVLSSEQDIVAGRVARSTSAYDERDIAVRQEELFSVSTGRKLVSIQEYDGNRNKVRTISPRAFDAAGGSTTYTDFVTKYVYDKANRVTRIDLPFDARDGAERQYMHRGYDKNGNVVKTSTPVTLSDPAAVGATANTVMTYFDPGWIRTSTKSNEPKITYDYLGRGMQSRRSPDVKGQPGTVDPKKEMLWEYYADSQLKKRIAQDGNPSTYQYDANNNLVKAVDASGVTDADDKEIETSSTFTGFDQPDKVKHRKKGTTTWKFTDYDYDLNGNVTQRLDNGEESDSGTQSKAPKTTKMTYDQADWLSEQLELGTDSACKGDQRILTTFWSTQWQKTRDIYRAVDGCTGDSSTWPKKQTTTWDHFDNGDLAKQVAKNGSGVITESHDVEYFEGARYEDGNRTKDTFVLKRASDKPNVVTCVDDATKCVSTFEYDARAKVLKHQKRAGNVTTYKLDEPAHLIGDKSIRGGNVTTQTVNNDPPTHRQYESNQLKKELLGSLSADYLYDNYGNVDCITLGAAGSCPTQGAGNLITDFAYDALDRLASQRQYMGTTQSDTADYTYDALDRVTKEVETRPGDAANSRSTDFNFEGLSGRVTEEKQAGGNNPKTKTFGYDAYGNRVSMTDKENSTTKSAETFDYSHDVQGSVSQLISDAGTVKASYGYDAYGGQESPDTEVQGLTTGDLDDKAPLNPYRYTGKRLDSGSATATKAATSLDMGARRYGVDTGRFLQQDMYASALGDLGLSLDPLTMNRYALAGGNPVSYIEVDGHWGISLKDLGHTVLDGIGMIPVAGELADGANAIWYAAEGDYQNAALSAAGMIPFAGNAATGAKYAMKYGDEAFAAGKAIAKSGDDIAQGAASLNRATGAVGDTAKTAAELPEGYRSFSAAKRALGSPGEGNVFDHVVEQSQIGRSGFAPKEIHNPFNMNPVSGRTNQIKANYYSTKQDFTNNLTVRDWLNRQSFSRQYTFGMDTLADIKAGIIR